MRKLVIFISVSIYSFLTFGQENTVKMLLTDQRIQLECTEAVDAMYNFKFEKAEKQFRWLKQEFPTHPLPYFLMGTSYWWRIMPWEDQRQYDDIFTDYMDSTIYYAEQLLKENKDNPEAYFFLAAAEGFKGRIFSDREEYTKAAFVAKKSLNHLMESERFDNDLSPEFLFGIGLYNYFRVWIPENKAFLKPIMLFFKKGDKELGLKQLQNVADHAFYSRIEAMTYLARIYGDYENNRAKALPILEYLVNNYPDNSYFATEFAEINYMMGRYTESTKYCSNILYKYENKFPGYTVENARKASFFLGSILKAKGDVNMAKHHFEETLKFSKEANAQEKGYYWYTLGYLAEYAVKEKNNEKAIEYYREIVEHCDKDKDIYKEGKEYLKKNDKDRKKSFLFF